MTIPPTRRRAPAWKWVAHDPHRAPGSAGDRARAAPVPRSRTGPEWQDATPAYRRYPRWGLPWPVAAPGDAGAADRADESAADRGITGALARQAEPLMVMTQWIMIVAAVAHGIRYVVLAVFARSVVPTWLEVITTALVWASGIFAFGAGLAAVACATAWLIRTRAAAVAPLRDDRSRRSMWLLCLVPLLNLVYPPVLMRELDALVRWRHENPPGGGADERAVTVGEGSVTAGPAPAPDPRTRTRINRWWLMWVLNWLALGVVILRGSAVGPQAAADTVALSALALAIGAGTAWMTRRVMHCFDDTSRGFTRRYFVAKILD